jgi:hypothetical protein
MMVSVTVVPRCLNLPDELFWNQLVGGLSSHEIDSCQDSTTGFEGSNSEIDKIISSEPFMFVRSNGGDIIVPHAG